MRVLEELLFGLAALLLELFELGFGLDERAVETLLVKAEPEQDIGLGLDEFGLSEGAVNGGVFV